MKYSESTFTRGIGWLLIIFLMCGAHLAHAQDGSAPIDVNAGVVSPRLLIGLTDQAMTSAAEQIVPSGWRISRMWPDLALIELTPIQEGVPFAAQSVSFDALEAARASLLIDPAVAFVELDSRVFAASRSGPSPLLFIPKEPTPDDPLVTQQWAIPRLEVLDGWSITQGDARIVIAIIDSGYDTSHEDLGGANLWVNPIEAVGAAGVDDDANGFVDDLHGWDWVENDPMTNDPFGHGTHVGATIAAVANNQLGVAGLGRSLRIMPLRMLDRNGGGAVSDLIDAISYARKHGAQIINLSLVMSTPSQALQKAVQEAKSAGLLVVAASGNSNRNVSWPAAFAETVAVGATDRDDSRAPFSNFGPELDLAAPGVDILSAYRNGSYHKLSGTSMATPHVSALAGLVWSLRPDLDANGVIDLLQATAVDANAADAPGNDIFLGAGRIDFGKALRQASAQLQLRPRSTTVGIVFAGDPVVYTLQVTTPAAGNEGQKPVVGAVTNYALTPEIFGAGEAPVLTGRTLSDMNGDVTLAFLAPEMRSTFHVTAAVGLAEMHAKLFVQIPPAQIEISGPTTAIPAGDTPVTLEVRLHDGDGVLAQGPMPLRLVAERGAFENGQPTIDLVVENGAAAIPFRPGAHSGRLLIHAQVRSLISQLTLIVEAQKAAQLTTLVAPQSAGAGAAVDVVFAVNDGLGNPVTDGTEARVFSSVGVVDSSNRTLDGRLTARITLPEQYVGVATVWAVVPGTRLQERIEFPVRYQLWFPIAAR